MARAGFGILGVLLQQAFVDLAFDINTQADPGLAVDQFEQTFEFCGILDFILRLAEDGRDETGALAKFSQDVDIVRFELVAIACQQAGPIKIGRNRAGFAQHGCGLIIHFQEEQIGELLDVIAIRDAVVAQDVAVIPDTLDDGRREVRCCDRFHNSSINAAVNLSNA